jgi:hypothetical protein
VLSRNLDPPGPPALDLPICPRSFLDAICCIFGALSRNIWYRISLLAIFEFPRFYVRRKIKR